ncbi:MAG TPA: SDR family NAD(P)-dependent oxidoreductase [Thermotogota bacterium]|nr:SDR family NAD(P)-dependent oxidoreductase [Thermotogota bacterium]HRW35894.1 SDR family NAD(P)-dependent oxidoreductase [Thermotogota bacterium]
MKNLKNKTAVITGAGSGIGLSIAGQCAEEGMNLVLVDIEEKALNQAFQTLSKKTNAIRIVADVSVEEEVKHFFEAAVFEYGDIHLLFNNAGVGYPGFIWQGRKQDWDWVMGVNLTGITHAIRYFIPKMIAQDCECRIINTCSAAALESGPGNGLYRVSKHAIIALSETLYHELQILKSKVAVSILLPGYVQTNICDAQRNQPDFLTKQNEEENELDAALNHITGIIDSMIREGVKSGTDPEKFADHVIRQIKEDKFYIFSDDMWQDAFEKRTKEIRTGLNPLPIQ